MAVAPPTEEILQRIDTDGYCILRDVIPAEQVGTVCDQVVAAQARQHEAMQAELAAMRERGHRVGVSGMRLLKQAINETQCFAPYLVVPPIMGVVKALFGDYPRISATNVIITEPGSGRGAWHADWPYNPTNTTHVPAPYPDVLMHLATIWMLTPFSAENGGTYILPGSHRRDSNPAGELAGKNDIPLDGETQATGDPGSVLFYDTRLWHATGENKSDAERVALLVRYAPWWLNLTPTMNGTPDHTRMVAETDGKNYDAEPIRRSAFDNLPPEVKDLYRHWLA